MADAKVTMPDKEALQLQEEQLEKKNKLMYPIVITVLILIFAVGFIYGIRLLVHRKARLAARRVRKALKVLYGARVLPY